MARIKLRNVRGKSAAPHFAIAPFLVLRTFLSTPLHFHHMLPPHQTQFLTFISSILGWVYVFCWGVSLYPQILKNYYSKSVIGLSMDFLAINSLGHVTYFLYNSNVFWNHHKIFSEETVRKVKVNDVIYSMHAVWLSCILIIQCVIYKRGEQSVSRALLAGVCLIFLGIIVEMYFAKFGLYGVTWLQFMESLASVKVLSSAVKYIPQVLMIYQGKTAGGISIATICCDFLGGLSSMSQALIDAYVDSSGRLAPIFQMFIFKRFSPKFALGCVSILFNSVFMYQKHIYDGVSLKDDTDADDLEATVSVPITTAGASGVSLVKRAGGIKDGDNREAEWISGGDVVESNAGNGSSER